MASEFATQNTTQNTCHNQNAQRPRMILLLGFLSTLLVIDELRADSIPGLFSTGCDNAGHVLPVGSAEQHYSLVGPSSDPTVATLSGSVSAPPGCAWIAPATSQAGLYTYTLHFNLAGLDSTSAIISGQAASDGAFAPILLNGVDTGYKTLRLDLQPFTLTNGFAPGSNTLQIVVTNKTGPSGLVLHLTGTVLPLPVQATIQRSGTAVQVCWQSESNRPYMVDYRLDLTSSNWTLLSGGVTGDGTRICVPDSLAPGVERRFYRVVSLPKP
jgi:hypothetical protein